MDTPQPAASPEARPQEATHPGWLVLAILLLLLAYIPIGYLAPVFGLQFGWELVSERKSLLHQFWGAWLMVATVLGNVQIVFCLVSPHKPSMWWQNPFLKTAATLGQLSWVIFGISFLPWFPWVIGSGILFTVTPGRFAWPNATETWTQDWRQHRLLPPRNLGTSPGHARKDALHPLAQATFPTAPPAGTGAQPEGSFQQPPADEATDSGRAL
jgi:hypothetical protein